MSPNLSLFVFKTGNESVTLFVLEPIGPERVTDHKTRRLRGDLIYMHKYIEKPNLFTMSRAPGTRGNSKKLHRDPVNNNIRKHSFTVSNLQTWNNLPGQLVSVSSLNDFKSKIDVYLNSL